jgi:hypothetical protein
MKRIQYCLIIKDEGEIVATYELDSINEKEILSVLLDYDNEYTKFDLFIDDVINDIIIDKYAIDDEREFILNC